MARRKRKEEAADWVPPDFDEVAYMRREMEGARAAVATIAWAVVGAIVAFLLYSVLPVLAFFAGIAVGFGMYFVFPLFGIRTESFKRRDWMGHGITYFFSWLAFWIILLNPPFGDFTDPTIQAVSVSPYTTGFVGNLTCAPVAGGSVTISMGIGNTSIYVLFRASDNVALAGAPQVRVEPTAQPAFFVTPTQLSGNNQCVGHRQESYLGGTYSAIFPYSVSSYAVTITARDPSGRQAVVGFQVFAS